MKIKTIGCSGTYEVGRPAFKKYWMEAELEENESENEAMDTLNQKIEDYNKKYNPEPEKKLLIKSQQPKLSTEEQLIKDIGTVTDIMVLDSYKMLAKKYPAVQEAFDNKLKELL